ncbi:hypothetical protein QJS66_21860 [Kocuria rhizophila]|nr:hypothetical protein QJS66_21860 [Kocuria rhizophila]
MGGGGDQGGGEEQRGGPGGWRRDRRGDQRVLRANRATPMNWTSSNIAQMTPRGLDTVDTEQIQPNQRFAPYKKISDDPLTVQYEAEDPQWSDGNRSTRRTCRSSGACSPATPTTPARTARPARTTSDRPAPRTSWHITSTRPRSPRTARR